MNRFIKTVCISFVLTFAVLNGIHAAYVHWQPDTSIHSSIPSP
jgi:hypothetical protein